MNKFLYAILSGLMKTLNQEEEEEPSPPLLPKPVEPTITMYDMDNVISILDTPDLSQSHRVMFNQVLHMMREFEQHQLTPIAIHNIDMQMIRVTSKENLEGKFIQ